MKKLILILIAMLFVSCAKSKDGYVVIDPARDLRAPEDRELNREEWETLFPGTHVQSGLWRYIDQTTNVVVYMNSRGEITTVKYK